MEDDINEDVIDVDDDGNDVSVESLNSCKLLRCCFFLKSIMVMVMHRHFVLEPLNALSARPLNSTLSWHFIRLSFIFNL